MPDLLGRRPLRGPGRRRCRAERQAQEGARLGHSQPGRVRPAPGGDRITVAPRSRRWPGNHSEVPHLKVPPFAVDDHGNTLVSFARGADGEPPCDAPLPAALIALWHADSVLMVFDRFHLGCELPGGHMDEGESPRLAAARELLEESGQVPDGPLRFIGYAGFVLASDQRADYAALFAGCTTDIRDFQATEEIAAIRWWNLREVLPGHIQSLDAYLALLTRESGSGPSPDPRRG
ncbi:MULTISPECIES: NUDIX hydrolase [unclassified Streptomyces]|uniref:NUDIX hydrolase n=1 Tax=unclassified Streptomyces TaxID=2593676 RepID=UPI003660C364